MDIFYDNLKNYVGKYDNNIEIVYKYSEYSILDYSDYDDGITINNKNIDSLESDNIYSSNIKIV